MKILLHESVMLLPHAYVQGLKVLSSIVVIVMNTLSNLAVLAPSEIICKCNKSVNFLLALAWPTNLTNTGSLFLAGHRSHAHRSLQPTALCILCILRTTSLVRHCVGKGHQHSSSNCRIQIQGSCGV